MRENSFKKAVIRFETVIGITCAFKIVETAVPEIRSGFAWNGLKVRAFQAHALLRLFIGNEVCMS